MNQRKPIVGLAGGIGAGKSTVARIMGELGGWVIDADALAREALNRPEVRDRLVGWWGRGILDAEGRADRRRIAARVFEDPAERRRLEDLIHPIVSAERDREIERAQADAEARFIVLDVPLLFEVGLEKRCDRIVFVDADEAVRLERVAERGWDAEELRRREKNQRPLDSKRRAAHNVIVNNGSEAECYRQVRRLLSDFLDAS